MASRTHRKAMSPEECGSSRRKVSPVASDLKDSSPVSTTKRRAAPQRKRAQKDPNAPTRPLSAYLLFLLDKQNEIRQNNSEITNVADVTRMVGSAWREITPELRKKYDKKALIEKERYLEEMAKYVKSQDHHDWIASHSGKKKDEDSQDTMDNESDFSPVKKMEKRKRRRTNAAGSSSAKKRLERETSVGSDEQPKKRGRSFMPRPKTPNSGSSSPDKSEHLTAAQKRDVEKRALLVTNKKMTESSSGVDLAQELRVPVFTTEFQAWNSQREKDLRAVRHAAHEMEIDVAGMEMQQEHDRRAVEDAANAESKLEDMRTIKNKIVSILVREFSGLKLPSGLTITEDSVEDYMAELESVTTKAPGRHAELLRKVKEVAPLLENYMPHLRDR